MRKIKFKGSFKVQDDGFYTEEEKNYIESKQHEILSISIGSHCTIAYKETVITVFESQCSKYDLLQFTGLTDKNGKEIYEGDIVKVVNSDNEVDPLDSDTGIGEVIFLVESGLWYISSTIHNSLFDIHDCYYIEIIGNIHDNPELLQK